MQECGGLNRKMGAMWSTRILLASSLLWSHTSSTTLPNDGANTETLGLQSRQRLPRHVTPKPCFPVKICSSHFTGAEDGSGVVVCDAAADAVEFCSSGSISWEGCKSMEEARQQRLLCPAMSSVMHPEVPCTPMIHTGRCARMSLNQGHWPLLPGDPEGHRVACNPTWREVLRHMFVVE